MPCSICKQPGHNKRTHAKHAEMLAIEAKIAAAKPKPVPAVQENSDDEDSDYDDDSSVSTFWLCECCEDPDYDEHFTNCGICEKEICAGCACVCYHKKEWELKMCDHHICANCSDKNERTHPDCRPEEKDCEKKDCEECGRSVPSYSLDDGQCDCCASCDYE